MLESHYANYAKALCCHFIYSWSPWQRTYVLRTHKILQFGVRASMFAEFKRRELTFIVHGIDCSEIFGMLCESASLAHWLLKLYQLLAMFLFIYLFLLMMHASKTRNWK